MSYKLAVASIIAFNVTLRILDEGRTRQFNFQLIADRITQEELQAEVDENKDRPVSELLLAHVTGWRGQSLVLDDATGEPAEFSAGAFGAMLGIPGAANVIFTAYMHACGAKGRQGN